ncbi:MAG: LLM class flavin-dependent oxidoreductase [Deltaproteobacteria bacterium]|nr:LLM class flavin-dependent oxidoreductase [Deltaproteobacteria bacterium]
MPKPKIGFSFLDRPSVKEQLRLTRKAEKLGYDAVWVAETRLARDAISLLGAFAAVTERITLGSSIVNAWTRGPALMAMTFATLDHLAPGRMIMGLGAYWDPLAWKQGIERRKPLSQMREYIGVVRRLLALEESVTFEGEVVRVRDLRLDLGYGDPRVPPRVPIYIGATGLKMAELGGEIADGVILNASLSPAYVKECLAHIEIGARRAGRRLADVDTWVIVGLAMSKDGVTARETQRRHITMYLGQQPHVGKAAGLAQTFLDQVNRTMGGWPPRPGGIEAAMELVPDEIVEMLCVAGTPEECRRKVEAWTDAGVNNLILGPKSDYDEVLEVFAP